MKAVSASEANNPRYFRLNYAGELPVSVSRPRFSRVPMRYRMAMRSLRCVSPELALSRPQAMSGLCPQSGG